MTRAVVLGAGMAGLLAARVLSDFYDSVVVADRDVLPPEPTQRTGVPQGRHLHSCLCRGTAIYDELFPGFIDEIAAAGAVVLADGNLSRVCTRLGRYGLNRTGTFVDPKSLTFVLASRPFLEFHVRRRVRAIANVAFLDNHQVDELTHTDGTVTGVRITNRANTITTDLTADLTVDATGRGSRTPAFLDRHGYGQPEDTPSSANWAYSSQHIRIPDGALEERMVLIQAGPTKPQAGLLAYENDTWILTVGRRTDYGVPPQNLAEMLTAAAEVVPPEVMRGLRQAQQVGDIAISRSTTGWWRRYEKVATFPKGLVVTGDAFCSLNPIYGQGMTMAALEAVALRDCLSDGDADLAPRFFSAAAAHIGPTWASNQIRDRDQNEGPRTMARRLQSLLTRATFNAAEHDIRLTERFFRVASLVEPPSRLRDPALLPRILLVNLRHPGGLLRPGSSRRGPA